MVWTLTNCALLFMLNQPVEYEMLFDCSGPHRDLLLCVQIARPQVHIFDSHIEAPPGHTMRGLFPYTWGKAEFYPRRCLMTLYGAIYR